MKLAIFVGLLLLCTAAEAQVEARVTRVATPRDAVAYATLDVLQVPKPDQPFVRYIWAPDPTPAHTGAIAYTLNAVLSQSAEMYYPDVQHGGALVRFDLRRLAPLEADFIHLRDTWEDLAAFDHYFHTNRTIKEIVEIKLKLVKTAPYQQNGKTFNAKWVEDPNADPNKEQVKIEKKEKDVVISEFSLHSGMENALLLHTLTGSRIPIVRSEWFILKAWTTLNDGFYYKFLDIDQGNGKFITLNDWLKRSGATDDDFQKWKANQKPADERAAMFRSKITDKPRGVVIFNGRDIRPSLGSPVITITEDIREGNFNPLAHPMLTLVEPKFDAHEAIKRRRNGTLEFLLANADGTVVTSVPDDIAVDRTVPGPGPVRLEPGMSCLACHGPSDGYIPVQNDIQMLLSTYLAVFDDENSKDPPPETLEVLAGKYQGDFLTPLVTLRRDQQRTCNIVTRGQTMVNTSAAIVVCRDKYFYDAITPRIACRDLGYLTNSDADAQKLFPLLVPKLPVNQFNVSPEDPFIAALRGYDFEKWPVRLRRSDWERLYADIALRASSEMANRSSKPPVRSKK